MSQKLLYQTEATAKGGREGRVRSEDGSIDLALTVPKELGGSGAKGANPEMLFASGYAACFESACRYVARAEHIKLGDNTHVVCKVGIGPHNGDLYQLFVTLGVHLDGIDRKEAEQIVHKAHNQVCPYSLALRNNVDVKVELI